MFIFMSGHSKNHGIRGPWGAFEPEGKMGLLYSAALSLTHPRVLKDGMSGLNEEPPNRKSLPLGDEWRFNSGTLILMRQFSVWCSHLLSSFSSTFQIQVISFSLLKRHLMRTLSLKPLSALLSGLTKRPNMHHVYITVFSERSYSCNPLRRREPSAFNWVPAESRYQISQEVMQCLH